MITYCLLPTDFNIEILYYYTISLSQTRVFHYKLGAIGNHTTRYLLIPNQKESSLCTLLTAANRGYKSKIMAV